MRSRGALTGALVWLTALAAPVPHQTLGAQAERGSWTVTRDPFVELWFHGLATSGARGFGVLPLYSTSYARSVRDAGQRGVAPSRLERHAAVLRAAFDTDSALEVLHFAPLYFVGERPEEAISALRSALDTTRRTTGARDPRTRSARYAAALATTLPEPRQRAVVLRFLDGLEDEWRAVPPGQRRPWEAPMTDVARWRAGWDEQFAPSLTRYLHDVGRDRGLIVPVPALGLEGRIVTIAGGVTVVAVAADASVLPNAPLLAAVRELAFPLLDEAVPSASAPVADRAGAERRRGAAATRAGALLLDATAPGLAASYRRLFTGARASPVASGDFERAYPIPSTMDSTLRAAVARHSPASPIMP